MFNSEIEKLKSRATAVWTDSTVHHVAGLRIRIKHLVIVTFLSSDYKFVII